MALCLLLGVPYTMQALDLIIQITECFQHMTARQKREYEIWWVLYLPTCVTDSQMRAAIRTINAKTTKDERDALLTGLRTVVWDYATCADL